MEPEGVSAVLWNTQAVRPAHSHGEVDSRLAGSLEVQDRCVLPGNVLEVGIGSGLFTDTLDTALNGRGFVERDIVSHTPVLDAGRPQESPDALR